MINDNLDRRQELECAHFVRQEHIIERERERWLQPPDEPSQEELDETDEEEMSPSEWKAYMAELKWEESRGQ